MFKASTLLALQSVQLAAHTLQTGTLASGPFKSLPRSSSSVPPSVLAQSTLACSWQAVLSTVSALAPWSPRSQCTKRKSLRLSLAASWSRCTASCLLWVILYLHGSASACTSSHQVVHHRPYHGDSQSPFRWSRHCCCSSAHHGCHSAHVG